MPPLYPIQEPSAQPRVGGRCDWPDCDGQYVDAGCASVVYGKPTPEGWVRCSKCFTAVSPRTSYFTAEQLLAAGEDGFPLWAEGDDWGRAACRACGGTQSWEGEPDGYAAFLPEHVRHLPGCAVEEARRKASPV